MKKILWTSLTLHDALHGFIQGRGEGKATIEENMAHQRTVIVQEPLFWLFIDVSKSYNFLYIDIYMEILREYGLGPNIQIFYRGDGMNKRCHRSPGSILGGRSRWREE